MAQVPQAAEFDPTEFVRFEDLIVLDEVQRVPELFLAIKDAVDAEPRPGRFPQRLGQAGRQGDFACERAQPDAARSVMEDTRVTGNPDTWTVFADCYLDALDQIGRAVAAMPISRRSHSYPNSDYHRSERTRNLAEWHSLLLEHLAGSQAEDRLDRLVSHPALGGPELSFVRSRLAQLRGDSAAARQLAQECLQKLPGHEGFAGFAVQVGAELPASTREMLAERAR